MSARHYWVHCLFQFLSRVLLFCDPMDYSAPGSSVRGVSQARILECVAISSSRGSSWPRDRTCVLCSDRQILYRWATWEAPRCFISALIFCENLRHPGGSHTPGCFLGPLDPVWRETENRFSCGEEEGRENMTPWDVHLREQRRKRLDLRRHSPLSPEAAYSGFLHLSSQHHHS